MVSSIAKTLLVATVASAAGMQAASADMLFKSLHPVTPQSNRMAEGDWWQRAPARIFRTQSLVFGQRCVTDYGSCTIAPQPVGSPCTCGTAKGKTFQ